MSFYNPFLFNYRTIAGNNPLALWQSENIYKIESGCIHLYIVFPQQNNTARIYVTTFYEGEIFCNIGQKGGLAFLAVGQNGTTVQEIPEQDLFDQIISDPLTAQSVNWSRLILDYYQKIFRLCGLTTVDFEVNPQFLQRLHWNFLRWAYGFYQDFNQKESTLLKNKNQVNQEYYEDALLEFSGLLDVKKETPLLSHVVGFVPNREKNSLLDKLYVVMERIGQLESISFSFPKKIAEHSDGRMGLQSGIEEICRLSKIRFRRIALRHKFWQNTESPILAFSKLDDYSPVVLSLNDSGSYVMESSNEDLCGPLDEKKIQNLDYYGYIFYRPFPDQLLSFGVIRNWNFPFIKKDVISGIVNGVLAALISTVVPFMMAELFDAIIPNAEVGQLLKFTVILLSVTFANALFSFVQSVAMLRISNRSGVNLNAALWDRLLRLPVHFFRRYSVADLAERAGAITAVHETLGRVLLMLIFTILSTLFNFLLLFHYHSSLAIYAFVIFFLTVSFYAIVLKKTLYWLRQQMHMEGYISSTVFQILEGLAKIKVAVAEKRVFAVWSKQYAQEIKILKRIRNLQLLVKVYNSALLVLGTWLVYWIADSYVHFNATLTLGEFIAFSAAFTLFVKGIITLSEPAFDLLQIVPYWERLQPILKEVPEISVLKAVARPLHGKVEVDHVSFAYSDSEDLALDDVSFTIEPGEFVALVGTSGSGKSTMLRVLLGFEQCKKGSVYYDDQDLNHVDVAAIRRNIGVVLQNGRLLSGDILTNIVGNLPLTMDDAWKAARWAGLEQDILSMPMGMHTMVGEGSSTLSGGQRQRIMIARALVRNPKILFFDEATSALDNLTQKIVQESLDNLGITRLVIAHRLSTVRNADKILVFSKGKIVQSGNYEGLLKEEGIFQDLIRRQMS